MSEAEKKFLEVQKNYLTKFDKCGIMKGDTYVGPGESPGQDPGMIARALQYDEVKKSDLTDFYSSLKLLPHPTKNIDIPSV